MVTAWLMNVRLYLTVLRRGGMPVAFMRTTSSLRLAKPRKSVRRKVMSTIHLLSPTPVERPDRKSTRLNSSHANISYAVLCLKKKYLLQLDKKYDVNTL